MPAAITVTMTAMVAMAMAMAMEAATMAVVTVKQVAVSTKLKNFVAYSLQQSQLPAKWS